MASSRWEVSWDAEGNAALVCGNAALPDAKGLDDRDKGIWPACANAALVSSFAGLADRSAAFTAANAAFVASKQRRLWRAGGCTAGRCDGHRSPFEQ